MEYNRQAYLRDNGDSDVNGIAIIETDESDGYRVTEKLDSGWCKPFWIPESHLQSKDTHHIGQLSSDQYLKVCRACGVN